MPMYRVVLTQTANAVVDVEADSPDAAREVAEEMVDASLCHQCSRDVDIDNMAWEAIKDAPELIQ